MRFSIRQASVHDLDVLAPLFDDYRQFYQQPSDIPRARAFLEERLAYEQSVILMADVGEDGCVGFTQLYPLFSSVRTVRIYLLNDLFIAPGMRRQGVAKALLTAAADHARKWGAGSLSLQTARDNLPAQALYESLGWIRDQYFYEYALAL